ncbi:Hsp20/alpha crystallin family protein [Paenibacillus daejeonensis]|uniref:Hsp20/alpha crystallin family protein n=1 Tax=Paenibacillus daejeonensis TaxID=135193 RepID=UPI00036CED16|nr:Hsp20/alpha crystallin family protein [Paenibacillus daejeonensis]
MFDLIPLRKRQEDMFGQMLKSFQDLSDDHWLSPFGGQTFRTDIREEKDRYLVEAELPGIAKENIHVDVDNGYLTIRAKRDDYTEQKDDDNRLIRRERRSGEFVRRFYVDRVDEDGIQAKLDQGVLKLEIPKRPGPDARRQIQIQ